ncbi:hypothetical protein WJ84_26265 [Burkholderia ubonensis]|nr:hypothetical protein WJ84_26265 [Burkholderia ubonensis]
MSGRNEGYIGKIFDSDGIFVKDVFDEIEASWVPIDAQEPAQILGEVFVFVRWIAEYERGAVHLAPLLD